MVDGERDLKAESPRGDVQRRGRTLATAGFVIGTVVLLAAIPACSSSSTPTSAPTATTHPSSASTSTTSSSSSVTFAQGSAAEVADCQADAETIETALEAYMAEKGAYPSPPYPWSAATYVADFGPLTAGTSGGPFLHTPPSSNDYVIEYDSAGHLWIAPPGSFSATYNPGQDFSVHPDICEAAVH